MKQRRVRNVRRARSIIVRRKLIRNAKNKQNVQSDVTTLQWSRHHRDPPSSSNAHAILVGHGIVGGRISLEIESDQKIVKSKYVTYCTLGVWVSPRIELGTSRTLSEHYTTKPRDRRRSANFYYPSTSAPIAATKSVRFINSYSLQPPRDLKQAG